MTFYRENTLREISIKRITFIWYGADNGEKTSRLSSIKVFCNENSFKRASIKRRPYIWYREDLKMLFIENLMFGEDFNLYCLDL